VSGLTTPRERASGERAFRERALGKGPSGKGLLEKWPSGKRQWGKDLPGKGTAKRAFRERAPGEKAFRERTMGKGPSGKGLLEKGPSGKGHWGKGSWRKGLPGKDTGERTFRERTLGGGSQSPSGRFREKNKISALAEVLTSKFRFPNRSSVTTLTEPSRPQGHGGKEGLVWKFDKLIGCSKHEILSITCEVNVL
jgi:hypothetical protein